MNIYGPETERCRELQRQLHDAEQFRALVAEMRQRQRRVRRLVNSGTRKEVVRDAKELRDRIEAQVDSELRLLESD